MPTLRYASVALVSLVVMAAAMPAVDGFQSHWHRIDRGAGPSTTIAHLNAAEITSSEALTSEPETARNEKEDDSVVGLEDGVVNAIQAVIKSASEQKPKDTLQSLGQFGSATGALVTQRWLTPQALEECASFWQDGSNVFLTDVKRFRLPNDGWKETTAFLRFSLLAANTFPWTPLLLPLVGRALKDTDQSVYLPGAFQTMRRKAWGKLQERIESEGDEDDANYSISQKKFKTPQNIEESLRFFQDGSLLLWRDLKRERLLSRNDSLSSYAWFAFLAFSTFPLTPLCLPVIDKRRERGQQSDYVPSAFRGQRLLAVSRARETRRTAIAKEDPFQVLHNATFANRKGRPTPAKLLNAIVKMQRKKLAFQRRESFPEKLGGEGRRWKLIYTADKDAVVAVRKQQLEEEQGSSSVSSWFTQSLNELIPWAQGVYVDGFGKAVQRFDMDTYENENGFFNLFGLEGTSFTVVGPYKWDRSICGFQPTATRLVLGENLAWEFPMVSEAERLFEEERINKLPFFNFILVDDNVAVAQGRSGGVALWKRIQK